MVYLKKISLLVLLLSLSACNEYWWTRGQPPSTKELLTRASERVEEISSSSIQDRKEILEIAEKVINSSKFLLEDSESNNEKSTNSELLTKELLNTLEDSFKNLEGKLSYTNRPPFNELSSQLRGFQMSKTLPDKSALSLYSARVLFFLSSELGVPKPDPIRLS